jgi:hypothetical protein
MIECKCLVDDEREIESIWFPGDTGGSYSVGRGDIEKIVTYYENGQMAMVPWFAVFRNGKLSQRINAATVMTVNYKDSADDKT